MPPTSRHKTEPFRKGFGDHETQGDPASGFARGRRATPTSTPTLATTVLPILKISEKPIFEPRASVEARCLGLAEAIAIQ